MKDELGKIEVPGEEDARRRTWAVLEAAYAERQPSPRPSHWPRVAAIALAVAALVAAALTPPGQAVIDEIREVVGVETAQPALFSLPDSGKLLVASDAGVWVVQADGSKRLLGDYRDASWSPFGRFVVAARPNELAALEPNGDVRWTLARAAVRSPRWTGSIADTRIAYLSGRQPRVVAGDGTDDRLGCLKAVHLRKVAPAWRPGKGFVFALAAPSGAVHVYALDGCRALARSSPLLGPRRLEWSSDATQLLVVARDDIRVLVPRGDEALLVRVERAAEAAFRPGSRQLAAIRPRGEASELTVGNRVLFRGAGELRDLAWSPDGRWILVTWPTADQWVFVRADGGAIRAVSNISDQFRSGSFPRVEGWCCAP